MMERFGFTLQVRYIFKQAGHQTGILEYWIKMLFVGKTSDISDEIRRLNRQCLGQRRREYHGAKLEQQAGWWWGYSQKHRTLKDELVWEKEKRAMDVFSVRPQ